MMGMQAGFGCQDINGNHFDENSTQFKHEYDHEDCMDTGDSGVGHAGSAAGMVVSTSSCSGDN